MLAILAVGVVEPREIEPLTFANPLQGSQQFFAVSGDPATRRLCFEAESQTIYDTRAIRSRDPLGSLIRYFG